MRAFPFTYRCPRCHQGKLYAGLLAVAERCPVCGLSLKAHEQGDGPAFLAITLIGTLAAVGATVVEIKYEPPYWLHAALWLPFVAIGTIVSLRGFKAMIIGMQYKVKREDFEG